MRIRTVLLGFMLPAAALALTENFDASPGPALPSGWKNTAGEWMVKSGALWAKSTSVATYCTIEPAGRGGDVSVQARVLPRRREGTSWTLAGVSIRNDYSNFWHFAVVDAPPDKSGKHYVELLECQNGVRNAQSAAETRLKQTAADGKDFAWEYNQAYILKLAIRGKVIEGILTEPDGTVRSRLAYELSDSAVKTGSPAVFCTQMSTVFDDIRADVGKPEAAAP